jgi:hypothetical protein
MQIFIIEDNVAKPHPELLLIPPFKQLWERDNNRHKENAIMDFTFIELMCSPRRSNPFSGYSEAERAFKIIEQVFKEDPDYIPDELVKEGMGVYLTWLAEASPSYKHWRANRIAAEKTQAFFSEFSYADKNPKTGLPVWKPKDITNAIKDAEDNIKTLDALQKKVESELLERVKTKGDRQVNYYEE